jgi:hypothetical protein
LSFTTPHPVLLSNTSSHPEQVRAWAAAHSSDKWDWMYLSDDYLSFRQWQTELGDAFSYIRVDRELELSAQRLKTQYLRWIAQLGKGHPEPAWWASRISERNTAISLLFENVCRLDVVRKQLQVSDRPLLIVSDSGALIDTLCQAAFLKERQHFRPKFPRVSSLLSVGFVKKLLFNQSITLPILLFLRVIQLFKQVIQAKFAGSGALPDDRTKLVLMHTYLDNATFTPDYVFQDRYFPGLDSVLKDAGFEVLVLPVMFNVNRSHWSAWSWTKSSQTHFVNPFKYYRVVDYIYALRIAYRTFRLPLGSLKFEGNDLNILVRSEARRTAFDGLAQILYLRLPLRLRENGVTCLALIAEFENMIPEKMLIQGFRDHQPNTELIGFQHGALYPHLLCNFTPREERGIAPTYDRVVCNGSLFRNILIREGLASDIAVIGGALRYKHLWTQFDLSDSRRRSISIDIFVPLPLMLPAGVELLDKLIAAFGCDTTLRVTLKAHPMSSVEAMLSAAKVVALPAHFQVSNEATNVILARTNLVVGLSTSTMFEAVAAGVPVVRLHRETALDLDPLAFLGDFSPSVCTAVELTEEVQRLLNLSDVERDELYREGRKLLAEAFHPCDEVGLKAFLPSRNSTVGSSVVEKRN